MSDEWDDLLESPEADSGSRSDSAAVRRQDTGQPMSFPASARRGPLQPPKAGQGSYPASFRERLAERLAGLTAQSDRPGDPRASDSAGRDPGLSRPPATLAGSQVQPAPTMPRSAGPVPGPGSAPRSDVPPGPISPGSGSHTSPPIPGPTGPSSGGVTPARPSPGSVTDPRPAERQLGSPDRVISPRVKVGSGSEILLAELSLQLRVGHEVVSEQLRSLSRIVEGLVERVDGAEEYLAGLDERMGDISAAHTRFDRWFGEQAQWSHRMEQRTLRQAADLGSGQAKVAQITDSLVTSISEYMDETGAAMARESESVLGIGRQVDALADALTDVADMVGQSIAEMSGAMEQTERSVTSTVSTVGAQLEQVRNRLVALEEAVSPLSREMRAVSRRVAKMEKLGESLNEQMARIQSLLPARPVTPAASPTPTSVASPTPTSAASPTPTPTRPARARRPVAAPEPPADPDSLWLDEDQEVEFRAPEPADRPVIRGVRALRRGRQT
jgi:ABC-type transporter Mla subunit MlaD